MSKASFIGTKAGRALLSAVVLAVVALLVVGAPVMAQEETEVKPNIVLVHGAWADGSSWAGVIPGLQALGYNVVAPQFPHTSLEDNVARLQQVLDRLTGPVILVGHSYGGQIITAGGGADPDVVGLVYIAAFGLDEGESIGALLQGAPPGPALAHLEFDALGYAWLPQEDFVGHFAADVDPAVAAAMWAAQQPIHANAFEDVIGVPAWKNLPSWYMVATNDEAIPPDAERLFAGRMGATTVEIESSHVPMVSNTQAVVDLIVQAAEAVAVPQ